VIRQLVERPWPVLIYEKRHVAVLRGRKMDDVSLTKKSDAIEDANAYSGFPSRDVITFPWPSSLFHTRIALLVQELNLLVGLLYHRTFFIFVVGLDEQEDPGLGETSSLLKNRTSNMKVLSFTSFIDIYSKIRRVTFLIRYVYDSIPFSTLMHQKYEYPKRLALHIYPTRIVSSSWIPKFIPKYPKPFIFLTGRG
jgi:hypothetical protein